MLKNISGQKIRFFAFDYSTGAPKTGDAANITAYVSKDRGALTVLADTTATEVSSTNAAGTYEFDLAQAETNGDTLDFTAKSSTANVSLVPVLNMQTVVISAAQTGDNYARLGAPAGASVSADVAAVQAKTANLPAAPAAVSDVPTAATTAAAVRTNLATELARIDVAVSSRGTSTYAGADTAGTTTLLSRVTAAPLLASAYTAPDNTSVAAIKAKTDNLPAAPASEGNVTAVGTAVAALPSNASITTAVWSAATRTLTSAGAGGATAAEVWGYATRSLTASSDPTAAQVATAVRTELSVELGRMDASISGVPAATRTNLATELARIDVAVSSRGTSTYAGADTAGTTTLLSRITAAPLLASAYTAPDNTSIGATLTRVNLLATQASVNAIPTAPLLAANYTAPPNAATVATAVDAVVANDFSAVLSAIAGISGGGGGATASAIAVAVVDQALTGHTTAGTVGAALQNASAAANPLAELVPGSYTVGTAGYALGKLNAPAPTTPVVVVPGAPAVTGACRVYGYMELPDKTAAAGVPISFELIAPGLVASERLVAERIVKATTSATGQLMNAAGVPYVDLNRTDALSQAAAVYEVTCEALGVRRKRVTLTTSLADLRTLLTT